ncbi:MAG: DUF1801 domain-containing protein [Mariniblastus sp.]
MAENQITVSKFLAGLPEDRRKIINAIRKTIKANVDAQISEGMHGKMISYFVPHKVYPNGYHCDPSTPVPFISIASQKNNVAIYLFCNYLMPAEDAKFREAWKKTGKRLDMGKSCLKVKKLEDIARDVLGKTVKTMTVKKFIKAYEASIPASRKTAIKKAAAKKPAKKASKKKPTKKKAVVKKASKKIAKKKKPGKKK